MRRPCLPRRLGAHLSGLTDNHGHRYYQSDKQPDDHAEGTGMNQLVEPPAEAEAAQNPADQFRQQPISVAGRFRALIGVFWLTASRKCVKPLVKAFERLFALIIRLGHARATRLNDRMIDAARPDRGGTYRPRRSASSLSTSAITP
jgi:hypothetical protein